MAKISLLLCLTFFFTCWQFGVLSYPIQGENQNRMLDNYIRNLATKDRSLENSLLSAFIMPEMPRGSPNQRKKAVDSTFIRFGRSSLPKKYESYPGSPASVDFDYFSNSNPKIAKEEEDVLSSDQLPLNNKNLMERQEQVESPAYTNQRISNDCSLKNKSDLFRALMGKTCVKRQVKRENVNDTFIRFGKRSVPNEPPEISNPGLDSDKQIRYQRFLSSHLLILRRSKKSKIEEELGNLKVDKLHHGKDTCKIAAYCNDGLSAAKSV